MKMFIPYSIKKIMSSTARRICSHGGFTLIELVTVILIAGIIMATAILSLKDIVRQHSPEELISELHLARISAIRMHRPVTATFTPNTSRFSLTWQDGLGADVTKMIDLGEGIEQYVFDSAPPGSTTPPPDIAFIFSSIGFISTNPGGNVSGNIYLTNTNNITNPNNIKQYQIQTTIAGGIELNRYDPVANVWRSVY